MNVLFVTAEFGTLAKVGGLADATAGLAGALAAAGHRVRVAMPAYGAIAEAGKASPAGEVDGIGVRKLDTGTPNLEVLLIEVPALARHVSDPYAVPHGATPNDEAAAWSTYCRAAALLADGRLGDGWRADALHAHDWPAGLAPVWLLLERIAVPSVFTIHNLAHHGLFPAEALGAAGLPAWLDHYSALEFHGQMAFIKGGIVFASRVTTVSPSYAHEIRTPAFGAGLDGLLSHRVDLVGILNGIDTGAWDPHHDPALPARYTLERPAGRRRCRDSLAETFALRADDAPIAAFIGRLQSQKGVDVLLETLPHMVERGMKVAVLGNGNPAYERALEEAAAAHPGSIGVAIKHDERLARRIYAGADMFVMPSHFEPCGLTQMYAMRYGCLPIAHAVGGLRDTITDGETGFLYTPNDADALAATLDRALAVFSKPRAWAKLRRNAMSQDNGWERGAAEYAQLYAPGSA